MALLKTKLITAATIKWSTGELFNGYLLLDLASGSQSTFYLNGDNQHQVPGFVKIPIRDGVLATDIEAFQNAQLSPVGMTYTFKWYDIHGTIRSTETGKILNADSQTIVPPTLG